jgi:short-subunit dehydrogenase
MKRVLITGVSRGIGKAIATAYASDSYVIGVATTDIKPDYVNEYIQCDLSDDTQLDTLCNLVAQMNIDMLINNAGINKISPFCEIDPDDFQKIQKINVYAPFRLCQAVLPHMAQTAWGRIVNISSIWGKISRSGRGSYSASKFALDGMTLAIANEYAAQGILANSVAPGFINTEMTQRNLGPSGIAQILAQVPINRLASVEEVANFVCWLGSEQNTYISGQNIAIDGGFTRA